MKIKNCKLKIILALSLFYVLCSLFLSKANAQSLSLGIYPPLLEVTIKPGKSITQAYELTNSSDTDLVINSEILPFEPADELGNIVIRNTGYENYFSFQNADLQLGQKFLLKAGQKQQIVLTIKIPNGAKEDDYYLTLLFTTQPENQIGGQGEAQAQAQIGTNILLTVSETGEPPRKAEIEEFSISNIKYSILNIKIIDSFASPQFLLKIKNTGRSFFKPMGTITTTGWFGQKYLLNLLPENILSASTRKIGCSPPDSPDMVGPCQIKSKFLLGVYTAKVEFGLDKISSDYGARITFIALPIKLFLVILVLIIFGIIGFFVKNRFKVSLDK